jgi:protein arginine N-methyltransferase 1
MYTIPAHLRMVSDEVRMGAYRDALRRTVERGSVVADIGTGTGIFAILACQLGARRVYAIEPAPAIEIARQIAADNGVADRIEFIRELSTAVALPERVDVVVADVNGILPLAGNSIATMIDARERFLAEGGGLIPARARVWAALAESREPHPGEISDLHGSRLGVDVSAITRHVVNYWRKADLAPEQILTEPQLWATLDYGAVTTPQVSGELSWNMVHEGSANGLCMWFDTELIDGVGFSNAPGDPKTIYGQAWFPLERPTELAPGDEVGVSIEARLVGDEYVWRWTTRITANGDGKMKAAFDQSTVKSNPVPLARLRRREADHHPALGEDGQIDTFILSLMNSATTLNEIARRVAERFPGRFPTDDDALSRVAQLSEQYSR